MLANTTPTWFPTAIALLVGWRVYVRFRRNIGRQVLNTRQLKGQALFFVIVSLMMLFVASGSLTVIGGLVGGLLAGVPLAFYGLKLTKFENAEDGFCYTPNIWLGISLSMVLVIRLAYRFAVLEGYTASIVQPAKGFMRSPLTLFVFGLLAGYYITYNYGVLKRSREARFVEDKMEG